MAITRVYPAEYPTDMPAKERLSVLDEKIKALKHWVCLQNGRRINPHNGKDAFDDQKATWGTFDEACNYIETHKDCVLGFQLGKDFEFTAVRIFGGFNEDGEITDEGLKEVFDEWDESYVEFDPSGTGVTFLFTNKDNEPPNLVNSGSVIRTLGVLISVCDDCIPITGNYCKCEKETQAENATEHNSFKITDNRKLLRLIYEIILETQPSQEFDWPGANEIDSSLDDVEGHENEKLVLSRLLKTNQYFSNLWNRITPTNNGQVADEIELMARILKFVSDREPVAAKLFRASPYFRVKSGIEQRAYADGASWPDDIRDKKDLDEFNFYAEDGVELSDFASDIMRNRLDKATMLKKQPNFASFDNDIKLFLDPIYDTFIDLDSDSACANLLIGMYGNQIKYCSEDDSWYVYTNGYWMCENSRDLKNIRKIGATIAKRVSAIPEWVNMLDNKEEEKKCKALKRIAKKFANVAPFKNILEAAKAVNPVDPEVFNTEADKIKVGNGTVSLRNGALLDDDPEDLFNTYTSAKYEFTNEEPQRFLRFLDEIFNGDKDLIEYFHRIMGYCITGETREQQFYVFHGKGSNGKSTLLNILQAVLDDYIGSFDSYALALKNEGAGRANPTILQNRYTRVVIVTETNKNAEMDTSLIKAISGGDKISTRMLFQNNAKPFRPTYKMIFSTNHLPNIDWDDYGIKRRYKIIPFNHKFDEDEKDPFIESNITRNERNLILNWLVEGAIKYYREGLGIEPEAVKKAISRAEIEGNTVKEYKNQRLEITKNNDDTIPVEALHQDYVAWCDDNDYDALQKKVFNKKLASICEIKKDIKSDDPGRCTHFFGVKFKE